MKLQADKSEYCIAEQLGTVCYHMSKDMCQRCKRAEEDRKRLVQEIDIKERSRR